MPIVTRVAGSSTFMARAKFEAMNRFEGPANGMRFRPKELSKMANKSAGDTVSPVLIFPYRVKEVYKHMQILTTDRSALDASTCLFFIARKRVQTQKAFRAIPLPTGLKRLVAFVHVQGRFACKK